jgi:hypothetical protein
MFLIRQLVDMYVVQFSDYEGWRSMPLYPHKKKVQRSSIYFIITYGTTAHILSFVLLYIEIF